ncbi:cytochrome P450 [Flagellatimonas centrodinii]|uniref:cytochrome P450 n=1 Tax=Flagellatimonas centrodinii TaxID=2806210 RepID=UPI001FEE81AD|nr:cytochrome P450 [Flagellatimonas centrodinii]ULQ47884.1 cytochrome P450 [Flagellatimonas centrodinii]
MTASALPIGPLTPDTVPPHLVVDFDVYRPATDAESFHQAYIDFQAATPHPLVWTHRNGGHWIAVRGEDVYALYADHERFSSRHYFVPATPDQGALGAFTLDPPQHAPFRAFLNEGLSAKVVGAKLPRVRQLAVDLADDLAGRQGCNFTTDFADALALTMFLDMVDLPFSDREHLSALVEIAARDPDASQRIAGLHQIADYLLPHIHQRRAEPGDDLLSRAVNADIDGRPITLEESLGAAIHLLGAGLDTVSSLFSFSMLYLARDPALRRALVDHPDRIPAAATELIRRFPVVVMARQVRADMDYLGVPLRQGEMVAIPTAFYNLDATVYDRPLVLDWDRRAGKVLSFGNGPHRCPGSTLGRQELIIGLQEWLKRIPDFSVAPGARIEVAGGTVAKVLGLPLVWGRSAS